MRKNLLRKMMIALLFGLSITTTTPGSALTAMAAAPATQTESAASTECTANTDCSLKGVSGLNLMPNAYAIPSGTALKPDSTNYSYNKILQYNLNALGFSCGNPDGKYGPRTTAAIKQFQTVYAKAYGLSVTGTADAATIAAINAVCADLQTTLVKKGFGTLKIDAYLGNASKTVIMRAQKAMGMSQTGIATQDFIAKLKAYGNSKTSGSSGSGKDSGSNNGKSGSTGNSGNGNNSGSDGSSGSGSNGSNFSAPYVLANDYALKTFELQSSKLCVLTSISMLVNTQLLMEGQKTTCTKDIVKQVYNNNRLDAYWSTIASKANKLSGTKAKLSFTSANGLSESALARLLDKSPAGVMIFLRDAKGNSHAVLVRYYEIDQSGNYHFYVSDPMSKDYTFVDITKSFLANSKFSWGKTTAGMLKAVKRYGCYESAK